LGRRVQQERLVACDVFQSGAIVIGAFSWIRLGITKLGSCSSPRARRGCSGDSLSALT
jgi:hypothetical protein